MESSQTQRKFDPARDAGKFPREFWKRRGLSGRASRELYILLCRLCEPGESQLIRRDQTELISDLRRLAGTDRGYQQGNVSTKLSGLQQKGFIRVEGGGSTAYEIEIMDPRTLPEVSRRRSQPRPGPSADEIQGQLFQPSRVIRLADFRPAGKESYSNMNSVPAEESYSNMNSASLYPRTRAVDDEVEDEDESIVESSDGVESEATVAQERPAVASKFVPSEEQFADAVAAVAADIRRWRKHRVSIPKPDPEELNRGTPHEVNLSLMIRARLAVEASRVTEAWYEHGIEYVLTERASRYVENCFAVVTRDWSRMPNALSSISPSKIGLPVNWYDIAARRVLPLSMLPPRLRPTPDRTTPSEEKKGATPEQVAEWDRRASRLSAKCRAQLAAGRPESARTGEESQRE